MEVEVEGGVGEDMVGLFCWYGGLWGVVSRCGEPDCDVWVLRFGGIGCLEDHCRLPLLVGC